MELKVSVSGIPELDAILKNLSNELKIKISRNAHIKASEPLIDAARARINFHTGRLNRSVGYENAKNVPNEAGAIVVGPRRGKGFKGYHGHLVEFGHRTRPSMKIGLGFGLVQIRVKKGGFGFVKPYPFMKPAERLTKNQVLSLIKFYVAEGIEKYVKKNAIIKK